MPWKNRRNPADSLEMCKAQPVHHLPGVRSVVGAEPRWLFLPHSPAGCILLGEPVGSQTSPTLLFCPFPGGCRVVFTVATNSGEAAQPIKATAVPSAQAEPFMSRAVAVTCRVVPEESCWKSRDREFHSTCLVLVSQIIKISVSGASLGRVDYSSRISGWARVA